MGALEERLSAMLARTAALPSPAQAAAAAAETGGLINGPKLDGDTGHASQQDVDALFS